jgi:hypothetical protein
VKELKIGLGYYHNHLSPQVLAMHRSRRRTSSAAWFSLCPAMLLAVVAALPLRADAREPATPAPGGITAVTPTRPHSTLDLRVVGPNGKPIPNGKIEVFSEPLVQAGQLQRGKFVRGWSSGVTLQANGEGRIALKPQAEWKRLALYIEAPGYARYWASWSPCLRSESIPANLTVKLEAGWSMGGTFVDVNGKPIADAAISLPVDFAYGSPEAVQWIRDERPKSGAEGKWHYDSAALE